MRAGLFVRFADIEVRIPYQDGSELAAQLRVRKDGSVEVDCTDNNWVFSADQLRELAEVADDFEALVAIWRRIEKRRERRENE